MVSILKMFIFKAECISGRRRVLNMRKALKKECIFDTPHFSLTQDGATVLHTTL